MLSRTLLLLPFTVLAACSDSNDGNGGVLLRSEFTASLDSTQEVSAPISGRRVRVTLTNRAPATGTFQTPVWVGFHDGAFDGFDLNAPASIDLERLAEDGNASPFQTAFTTQGAGTVQGMLAGELGPSAGPIAPGETVSQVFELDPFAPASAYVSYATMIIPSNDAFIANDDPRAHPLFDVGGNFLATDFVVGGSEALEAGTEVNDEAPLNTGFFGQTTANSGVAQGGSIAAHPGFLPPSSGGILDDPMFAAADFTVGGYQLLAVDFDELPAGGARVGLATVTLMPGGLVTFDVSATGLSGPATAAHFHMGAPGVDGPVVLAITSTIDVNSAGNFRARGSLSAPAGFARALRDGQIYVNVHTALNPSGEIRGQVVTAEAFTARLEPGQAVPAPVDGSGVRVTVTNRAPATGTLQSPVWVGFHDGSFEVFDLGVSASTFFPATNALERLAEDGQSLPLGADFSAQGTGRTEGALQGLLGPSAGPIAPGETVSRVFRLDPLGLGSRFLAYASMILPSNDAFIANEDPLAHELFDAAGNFVAVDFVVQGSEALDAGSEVNDELPLNTGFFGQITPDTGISQGGLVGFHPGFLPPGSGGILDAPMFAAADFGAPGYEMLSFRFVQTASTGPASGTVIAMLDAAGTELDLVVSAHGLSGSATGLHFHEALAGVAGPIVLDVTDTIESDDGGILTARGSRTIASDFVDALRRGDIYLDIHTGLNPGGEIRGQVTLDD